TVSDPGLFQFTGATVGPLFGDLALGTPMVAGFASNPLGIGPGDFSGPLILATLHFNALHAGSSSIGGTWDSSDLNQGLGFLGLPRVDGLSPVNPISAATTVQAVATVPEPSSLLLTAPTLVLLRRVLFHRA